jgi:hypothetical protein
MAGYNGVWTFVVACGFAALIGHAAIKVQAEEKANIKRFGLDTQAIALKRDCENSLGYHKKDFKQGMSTSLGCSCIAGHIASKTAPEDYKAAASAFLLIVQANLPPTERDVDRAREYFSTKVTRNKVYAQMVTAGDALLRCAQSATYARLN